ncbi:hypothetical protein MAPG_04439 [Magnaporthiopsis poae ATCC 64411]|uniref:Uncharacterized protein n=1 Tax=Magnaporthiopsis poae (strain ATCC 64411 / 73-15) TaxID=644358 RepID=A0A0C4DWQ9_MAGP6|nr:hypothetical protein MAPG_04439 [Magnaporthiopsis poae ATCC 64411]
MPFIRKLAIATLVAMAACKAAGLPVAESMDNGNKYVNSKAADITDSSASSSGTPTAVAAREVPSLTQASVVTPTPMPGTTLDSNLIIFLALVIPAVALCVGLLICTGRRSLKQAMRRKREAKKGKWPRSRDDAGGRGRSCGSRSPPGTHASDASTMSETCTEDSTRSGPRKPPAERFEDMELPTIPARASRSHRNHRNRRSLAP